MTKTLFAHIVDGVELASLRRAEDGRVLLSVARPGIVTLPVEAVGALGDAARHEKLRHKRADDVGD